jgi:methyltransferase family protein
MEADSVSGVPEAPSSEQLRELRHLLDGYRVSQAIYVMAALGIADLLTDGPQRSDELARATATHTAALYRVLRFLAAVGLFREVAPRRFALTTLGAGLRSDVPGSVRPAALNFLDPSSWQSWGALLYSVAPARSPSATCQPKN